MNTNIKVSIITPSCNQGQFIEQTILSVLNQTYKHIEYIIVDGGSTDNTLEIIDKYRSMIDIVISEKDKGQSDAINKGFGLATGVLAGWINSDDILYPDCVKKIVELYTQHPNGSIYYPSVLDFIDKDGKLLRHKERHRIPDKNHLLNKNYSVIQQGSFYSTACLKEVGYVDESIYYCMDLDLWLRLLDKGKIYSYDSSALSAFRMWEDTKTTLAGARFLENIQQVLNKYGAKKLSPAQWRLFYFHVRILGGKIKRLLGIKTHKTI
jgi:glycosyltransferase involved in cell wall biosynthesis